MSTTHSPEQKLASMANQIADYFRSFPESESASGVADHIAKFWAPKMRASLIAFADGGKSGIDPLALKAVEILKEQAAKKVVTAKVREWD